MPVYVPAEAPAARDGGSSSLTRLRGSRDAPASVTGLQRSSVSRNQLYSFRASTIQDRPVPEKTSADTPACDRRNHSSFTYGSDSWSPVTRLALPALTSPVACQSLTLSSSSVRTSVLSQNFGLRVTLMHSPAEASALCHAPVNGLRRYTQ